TLGGSPWAGAAVHTPEQAQTAFVAAERLSWSTLPEARTRLGKAAAETGLRPAARLGDWRPLVALLDGVAATLMAFRPEVYGADRLHSELSTLDAFLPATDLWAFTPSDAGHFVGALVADERTLRRLPRLAELSADFDRLGLAPLLAEVRSSGADPAGAVARFD